MGYLFCVEDLEGSLLGPQSSVPIAKPCVRPTLSSLEWSVVALARRDRLSTLRVPGRLSIAMGGLFGTPHNPRLACPRLEAVRRIAVLSWHCGFAIPGHEVTSFTGAGFTLDQYELLVESVRRTRAATAQRHQS